MSQKINETNTFNSIINRVVIVESVLEQGNIGQALEIIKRLKAELEESQDRLLKKKTKLGGKFHEEAKRVGPPPESLLAVGKIKTDPALTSSKAYDIFEVNDD